MFEKVCAYFRDALSALGLTDCFCLKYNVETFKSTAGSGGEYEVQEGFGWTNGVILDLLLTYGDRLRAPPVPPLIMTP